MAHLYLAPEADSLYLDVTSGNRSPISMVEVAKGVYLHADESGEVVAIEVMGLSSRGGLRVDDLEQPDGPRPGVFDEIERATGADRREFRS